MPHLKDLLSQLPNFDALPLPVKPSRVEAEKVKIRRFLGETMPKEPSPYDLMETYRILSSMAHTAESFANLPTKHLKRAPWVVIEPPEGQRNLADNQTWLAAYLEGLALRLFSPAIVILAIVFLRYYPESKPYFHFLRQNISLLLSQLSTLRGRSMAQRAELYGFFLTDGSMKFGSLLADANDPSNLISEAGLDVDTSQRGFVQLSVEKMLERLTLDLQQGKLGLNKLENILSFLVAHNERIPQLRFPLLRAKTADALLLPFGSQSPDPGIEEAIREFLLEYFHDPRIQLGNWQQVSEEARSIFMRWLVHGTLKDFFRVVREGSHQNRDADRMWPYREAFWSAYLRKGVISDAWVILGDMIAHQSRQFLSKQINSYGNFARWSGVTSVHAALILRIGDLVITEWNYSGKYRVWLIDNQTAPKFYRKNYTKNELTFLPDFEKSHHGAENGTWQSTLASYIAEQTGVRIAYREYMPK